MPSDGIRPPAGTPEFRSFLVTVVNSSANSAEAMHRMGYSDPSTVRYHMMKLGVGYPGHWRVKASSRPSARGLEFRTYLEGMVKSSGGPKEAADRMGYASPTTVLHHLKRLGIEVPGQWNAKPSPASPEFRSYFEGIVNASKSMTEAVKRLGYTRPQSVRYNLKRFRIEVPAQWYSHRDMRPSTKDPGFRAYFENVVKTSESLKEAMEKMGYAGPTSVQHHMRKLGIRGPDRWYGHPSTHGPEFAPYFENVVRTSKTIGEAVRRLGYANPSVIRHHLKRLGLEAPPTWGLKPGVSRQRRGRVPEVIIEAGRDRVWVAALHQGEGALLAHYLLSTDETALELRIGMTDQAPIFRFCDSCGTRRPKRPRPRDPPWKPMWIGAVCGLRAYRVVQEILPFLEGQKLEEAKHALEFFAPDGYRKGRYGGYEVWPEERFPLRKRSLASYAQSMLAKNPGLYFKSTSAEGPSYLHLDRICMRIADVLLDTNMEELGLDEIMDRSGVSWTAVIHHLKHLEGNSLVAREKVHRKVGPRLLFRALHRLVEVRELGWVPDELGQPPEN